MSLERVHSEWRQWLVAMLTLVVSAPAWAATINVPADHPTIQAAVLAAAPGDRIRVAPGDYQESVRIDEGQTGLIIEAADPARPPVILGTPYDSADGFRVDDVDGVVIRNFVILDAYDGVRLNNVNNALLVGLRIERNALGIRVNRGSGNMVAGCTVIDTLVEQGILLERTPGSILWANVVRGGSNEAIRISGSQCVVAVGNAVSEAYGNGIEVEGSQAVVIEGSTATGNNRDGFHITSSNFLRISNNVATGNNNHGFMVDKSYPIATASDLLEAGNQASNNPADDYEVHERRTIPEDPPACMTQTTTSTTLPPPTTTSTLPPPTTTTTRPPTTSTLPTTTTTTRPPTTSTLPTTTTTTVGPATTTTTVQPLPFTAARWRFYVRYARAGGSELNANVPMRSGDAPLNVAILTAHLSGFPSSKRLTEQEIQALGGDTLLRLRAAVAAHIQANLVAYPGFTSIVELKWAAREP